MIRWIGEYDEGDYEAVYNDGGEVVDVLGVLGYRGCDLAGVVTVLGAGLTDSILREGMTRAIVLVLKGDDGMGSMDMHDISEKVSFGGVILMGSVESTIWAKAWVSEMVLGVNVGGVVLMV